VRVTREKAAAHRRRILEVAGTLFRQRGFDGAGVADIMKGAGLTHGGFYGHFASKDDLAAEACTRVLAGDDWAEWLAGTLNPSLGAVVRGYLAPRHRDDPAHGCLLAALGSDVVRQPRAVRRAITEGVRFRVDALLKLLPCRLARARRKRALATMAGLVGALILSRAVDDPKLSDEFLDAAATTLGKA
jgi:TetR/AcrR family transcriptional regulator, transcriptional repressor for nem operon